MYWGVTVTDEVIRVFNDMKVRKSSTQDEVKKRKKAVMFCMSEDKKNIIVEDGKQILTGSISATWKAFQELSVLCLK
uniref:Cofilin 2 (muscle) n=1 Tax=Oryzias latipes TaxID=8090 RepID=A0A3P9JWL9_ORYLA